MIVVIIAGGSGSRLWPLSTPAYPKHLLQINNDKLSLLQRACERARKLTDQIYVVSETGHIKYVKEQLSDVPPEAFIVEPARRGTANCIVAALAHIGKHHAHDEPVAFIHADHYIQDINGFVDSFHLADTVTSEQKRIVLIGVEPTGPATIFGYIEKGAALDGQDDVFNVSSFKEKPDRPTAEKYLKSGKYLWNGGYFIGSLDVFVEHMRKSAPGLADNYERLNAVASPEEYEKVYLAFESEAIDYALIEKVPDLLVVPASFDWMDLGSFGDLAKAAGSDKQGNSLQGDNIAADEVTNSFIYNDDSKPLAVIGLDDVIVVNTPNGVLVTRKDMAPKVGEISKQFNNKQ
jgi:mannose-1-phosphate guanylyltransferase